MAPREFDLNIEKVLENWSVAHAIREIIANALDEQILTESKDIQIFQDQDMRWHIRDFGRGLQYYHFTQNENEEKLNHPHLIGKFGVGLKDALATFDRNNIGVIIDSKYGHFTIGQSSKHGFDDITTLHAYIEEPVSKDLKGTDFCLSGCKQEDINEAKNFFLKFAGLQLIETTDYGDVYSKRGEKSEIFINGIKVAEEDNFLFSYNITSLNAVLRRALNRERTNVGRSAYSERVRSILLCIKTDAVINTFTDNLKRMSDGTQCDEMKWVDVQTHAIRLLHSRQETVYVTPEEIENSSGSILEIVRNSGKTPVFVPNTVKNKQDNLTDDSGNPISTISTVVEEYNQSFEYDFVPYDDLSESEKRIMDLVKPTLEYMNSDMTEDRVFISNRIKQDNTIDETMGVYESSENRIIISRKQLLNKEDFLGTLIHELIHADSHYPDISRAFESRLTRTIGILAAQVIK